MKNRSKVIFAAFALMLAACALAAGIGKVEYATADLAKRTATVAWTWTDLADNAVRLSLTRNGEDFPTGGWGGTLFIGDGALGCAVSGVANGYNELLFDVGRDNVPTNGKYAVQILATNDAGRVEEWVRGTLTVRANPAAEGMPTNWGAYAEIARKVAPYIDAQGILSDPANADALWGAVSNRTDALIQAVSPTPDFSASNETLVATIEAKAPAPDLSPATNYTDAAIAAAGVVTTNESGEVGSGLTLIGSLSVGSGITSGSITSYGDVAVPIGLLSVGGTNITDAIAANAAGLAVVAQGATNYTAATVEGASNALASAITGITDGLPSTMRNAGVIMPWVNGFPYTTGAGVWYDGRFWICYGGNDYAYPYDGGSYWNPVLLKTDIEGVPFIDSPIPQIASVQGSAERVTALSNAVYSAMTVSNIGAYPAADGSALANIVNSWEGYWGGTNVIFEVTNYYGNTSGEFPRLRIKELRDGVWTNVWDEANKFDVCASQIVAVVAASNTALKADIAEDYAPKAWGVYTDKGATNVVGNSVWMTSPETYFAGGMEYQRVAVGDGVICVLTENGASAYTAGEAGTFRFQDEGGTNYFGFAKSDSYTIGCKTDGITVSGNLVTLRYDVIVGGTDVPIVYWRQTLTSGEWAQLNNADGTACADAPYTVTWYTSGGSYYAAINCGSNSSGFFKAETAVAGDVVFETNMKARLGGGIECTNTQTGVMGVIRPTYNGSAVNWTWSAR